MTSFFELCIRRPVLTIMMSAAIAVFGAISLTRLPVRELPDADPVVVNILTLFPGASAAVVESEVTERIEEAVSSSPGIKQIISESREETSAITVEFVQETDEDVAAQEVRDRVARVRGLLPDDIEEPVVSKQDASARPIMWIALASARFSTRELTDIAERQIKDRLQTVPGVSQVILGGEKRFAVRLWLDSARMAATGTTVADVERALRTQSVELPSGRVENLDRELTIQTRGQLSTPEEFERLIISQDGTSTVRLSDIGRAEDGVEDVRSIARFNSQPAIGLGVVRQSRANTLDVANGVKRRMDEIAPLLPEGIQYQFPYDESVYVDRAVKEVFETLGIAFVLVVLTIFVFLRDVRSTLIPALTVPVSVLGTFALLNAFGFSINIFTLLALVLAIGIVVDDSIVVLENIYRHIEEGSTPFQAAIRTMREIAFAIVTITLSLAVVFLPLAFVGGLTGKLLLEFAVALAGSVVCSGFVALTLSPMASARLLRPVSENRHGVVFRWFERRFENLGRRYERLLGWSLNHRASVVFIALASLALAFYFYRNLQQEFLPEEDKGRFLALALTPEGSTPEYTDRMVRQMEEIAAANPAIESYFTAVALPFNGAGDATQGFMFVRLRDGDRPHVADVVGGPTGIGARFFGEVEGSLAIPIMPKAVDLGISQPFELVVTNPDLDRLYEFSNTLLNRLRQEGFLANVRSTFELTKPELRIRIDRDRAGVLGVSVADVSRTLQVLFGGSDIINVKRDGRQYDVIVQLERETRLTPSDLERVYVPGRDGQLVQLNNLVRFDTGAGPNRIERFNRERSTTIQGTPAGVPLGTAMKQVEAILDETLPPGFGYGWRGESQNLRNSSRDLYFFMLLAIIVVYMVLASQFESFVHPLTVMVALPLAMLGAFGLLYALSWVNHFGVMLHGWVNYAPEPAPDFARFLSRIVPRIPSMNLNIFSQVGLVLLIGLVTKNSILLVEFANQERARGADPKTAMLRAGRIRLRPILMTSLATIAGILPIAIGFGEAADGRRPLGVVAVGGLVTSTLLTLFVIPVLYTLLARLERPNANTSPLPSPGTDGQPLPPAASDLHSTTS